MFQDGSGNMVLQLQGKRKPYMQAFLGTAGNCSVGQSLLKASDTYLKAFLDFWLVEASGLLN